MSVMHLTLQLKMLWSETSEVRTPRAVQCYQRSSGEPISIVTRKVSSTVILRIIYVQHHHIQTSSWWISNVIIVIDLLPYTLPKFLQSRCQDPNEDATSSLSLVRDLTGLMASVGFVFSQRNVYSANTGYTLEVFHRTLILARTPGVTSPVTVLPPRSTWVWSYSILQFSTTHRWHFLSLLLLLPWPLL